MTHHGARSASNNQSFLTDAALQNLARRAPHEVIITKTQPRQFSGPLPLADSPLLVAGPNPEKPDWIAVLIRQPDGTWKTT